MAAMPDNDRVLLGYIAGAHGIRGEVLVKSYTDDPADIAAYGPLSDEAGTRTIAFTKARVATKGVIAKVDGVEDRNGAEALKGARLYVDRALLPAPDDDEFYYADLIGLDVVTTDGTTIGTVVAIQNYGAGDLVEYRLAGSKRTELLPFNEIFVPDVDLDARRITVVLPETDDDEDA
jgi:16S rRNA processing protein RimM